MRFMLLMIPKGYENAAPGTMPDPAHVAQMMAFNAAMQEAGIVLALDGLHPPAMGARVTFDKGAPEVTKGPFSGVGEVLGGYWMIRVDSLEEAIGWAKRCPAASNETIEIRRVMEMEDFAAQDCPAP
jgi:hypothetical protein